MKKIYITIFALAAISGAAYADGDSQLRNSDAYFGKYSTQLKSKFGEKTMTVVSPLAIDENATGLTTFERMMKNSREHRERHESNRN